VERSDGEPVEKLHRLRTTSLGLTFAMLCLIAAAAVELHEEKSILHGPWRIIAVVPLTRPSRVCVRRGISSVWQAAPRADRMGGRNLPHAAVIALAVLPIVIITTQLVVVGVVGIKLEQQADDYAASVVGADEMRRALEKLAEDNMMKLRTGRFWNIMSQHPGMEQRIQRLQERARSEQSTSV
jgi:hypothetical protein